MGRQGVKSAKKNIKKESIRVEGLLLYYCKVVKTVKRGFEKFK